ncbi:MAG: hypothetical protein VKO00_04310 [Cyanobacteriota bacterium]|nr:hypothetical protein [Cyanobacteriota bacterium]
MSKSPSSREVELLERELSACRAEIAALHDLLDDLPGIFEAKFRQRLQPLLEHRDQLLSDNQALRQQMLAQQAERDPHRQLPEAPQPPAEPAPGLRQRLRQLFRRGETPQPR